MVRSAGNHLKPDCRQRGGGEVLECAVKTAHSLTENTVEICGLPKAICHMKLCLCCKTASHGVCVYVGRGGFKKFVWNID